MNAGRKVLIIVRVPNKADGILKYTQEAVGEATFHQFGLEADQQGTYSTAIIEWPGGRVDSVLVHQIQFVNPPAIEKEVD